MYRDWIKELDPAAKAFTASQKDRSAIAMGGHANDAAFWYDRRSGGFTTSDYYPSGSPDWLATFNSKRLPDRHFARGWTALHLSDSDIERLGIQDRDEGIRPRDFPHSLGGLAVEATAGFYGAFAATPFSDAYLLAFAAEILRAERLGQREHLDYLAIGLSALDLVGHSFGPESREAADVVLRLDEELGRFLDILDELVGLDRVVIALSADHGVAPVPEISAAAGQPGRRAGYQDHSCFHEAGLRVGDRFGLDGYIRSGLYLDREAIAAAGVEPTEVEAALARELETCSIVERAWTRTELANTRADEPNRMRRMYRHSFDPERSADIILQLTEYSISSSSWATHGSPYPYDTHVPLILWLPGVVGSRISDPVRIVDAAPTLASLLGIPVPDSIDGRDLTPLLAERAALPRLDAYAGSP